MVNKNIKVRSGVQIMIEKELLDAANIIGVRLKTRVRDLAEETYKENIRNSYGPISERGKSVQAYNENHTHKKAANYHHTGLFLKSIYSHIDGDKIKVEVGDLKYDDGTSTKQVYKWLSRGTRKRPKYPYYPVEGNGTNDTPWAKYVPTPKHDFNRLTILDMENYFSTLKADLENENSSEYKYLTRYYKKKPRVQK